MDNSTLHPACVGLAHLIELHLWRGAPINNDPDNQVQILVNHGYIAGFCPNRLQPLWSAYRVAHADDDVDYDRPLMYFDDMRLNKEYRIGRTTFGKLGDVRLNVGHMTPNEVINRQYGRLAQLETFMMSNMSPQFADLNQGVWLKLETAIREIKDEEGKDHVWVIVGPIFSDSPSLISRTGGRHLPIPDSYFCIVVDPHSYPFNTPSRVDIDCFIIPQSAPRTSSPDEFPATLEQIESLTHLNFFDSWSREIDEPDPPLNALRSQSRIRKIFDRMRNEEMLKHDPSGDIAEDFTSISQMIRKLTSEAEGLAQKVSSTSSYEARRVEMIQHTVSWLIRARELAEEPSNPPETPDNLITYKIHQDHEGRLKRASRIACNFWNHFVMPRYSIVVRLGLFAQSGNTIARAYLPYVKEGVHYTKIEMNSHYLAQFNDFQLAATITHEIGHALGIGWEKWKDLIEPQTGTFKPFAVDQVGELKAMEVEREGGEGTALAHWDEHHFDCELMTGYQDNDEHVLPVTINMMELLGHQIKARLSVTTPLQTLLEQTANVVFMRQTDVKKIDLNYYEQTDLFECVPERRKDNKGSG